jgi:6-phosphofructokinase 2
VIATLTLNPCLDNYISVRHLEMNETNRSQPVRRYAGGKGLDVSRAIHEMGGATIAFGFAGGNEGTILTTILGREGVPFSFIPINEATRSCYIIDESEPVRQLRISTPGPAVTMKEVNKLMSAVWGARPAPEILVCGGSVPPGLPDDIYAAIISQAQKRGIKTILDSSGIFLKEGVRAKPCLIKPNRREAEELLGRPLILNRDIVEAVREMVDRGIETAVISLGKDGVIAADSCEAVKAAPPRVTVASTVGAGDSAVAGLAIALSEGRTLAEACRLATAMGTAAVLSPGTALARRADVEALLPQIKVRKLKSDWT